LCPCDFCDGKGGSIFFGFGGRFFILSVKGLERDKIEVYAVDASFLAFIEVDDSL
jgi:hypothetical protein